MGYRITYKSTYMKNKTQDWQGKSNVLKWIFALIVCFFLLLAIFNTEVRRLFLPGDPVVTERALSELVVDIREGQPVSDAVTAFCREILENA